MTAKNTNKKAGPGDSWRTPPEVISFIEGKFGEIKMDLCSDDKNKVTLDNLSEVDDFLDDKWINSGYTGEAHWCNPPYSNPLPFVKQCVKWAQHGYAVAGILNSDTSTNWFIELANAKALLMPIVGGRIHFLNNEGVPVKKNNKPQVMFYLAPFLAQSVDTEYVHITEIYKGQ